MMRSSRTARPKSSAYDKALSLLARREHSLSELRRKLGQNGYDLEQIRDAMARLETSSYQDDQRFGEALLRNRVQQGYGPLRIRVELRSHGLNDGTIARLIDEAAVDWNALAQRQWLRHYGSEPAADPAERQRRVNYLLRRGFSGAQIRAAALPVEGDQLDDDGILDE